MDKQKGELLNEYINFKFNYNEVKYLYKYVYFRYTGHTVNDYFIENHVFHNDSTIISGSTCGYLWCWDFVSAQLIGKLKPNDKLSNTQSINSISIHPSKKLLNALCGSNINVWSD